MQTILKRIGAVLKMIIGIVTTWFERGAAYVSKAYMQNLMRAGHKVLIYARGGEENSCDSDWSGDYVTFGKRLYDEVVDKKHFFDWIVNNGIEAVLFNEQRSFDIVAETKKAFSAVKLGCYVDYYTESTLPWFDIYDFLICNTRRHETAMKKHPQKYYLRWGTDIELFHPKTRVKNDDTVRFFHSVGMSPRKGTDILLDSYIDGRLYQKSKLIIHTQIPIEKVCGYGVQELNDYGIEIIHKTVTAPGLYHMGDVYVYPTKLDGLGLTMYEALASGMPVITTNSGPMNEIIDDEVGTLVEVEYYYCRKDAYYWPMSVCNKSSLIQAMEGYIDNPRHLIKQSEAARQKAVCLYDWTKRVEELNNIFVNSQVRSLDNELYDTIIKHYSYHPGKNIARQLIRKSEFFYKLYSKL